MEPLRLHVEMQNTKKYQKMAFIIIIISTVPKRAIPPLEKRPPVFSSVEYQLILLMQTLLSIS